MDDFVLQGTDLEEIQQLKAFLDAKFSIKDLGVLKYFQRFELTKATYDISLFQRKYALDLILDAVLIEAKPCNTPMQPHLQLHKSYGTPLSEYRALDREPLKVYGFSTYTTLFKSHTKFISIFIMTTNLLCT